MIWQKEKVTLELSKIKSRWVLPIDPSPDRSILLAGWLPWPSISSFAPARYRWIKITVAAQWEWVDGIDGGQDSDR